MEFTRIRQGSLGDWAKKIPKITKSFFCISCISETTIRKCPKMISHLVSHSNSGQKNFFLKIFIFAKVTGLQKIFVPKISEYGRIPPPCHFWAQKYRFFQNSPNSPKTCLQGFSNPKFSILSIKKSKIVILVPKITQIRHGAIFRKNQFFHVF